MCSNKRDKLLIGPTLDKSNVSLFPEEQETGKELHRIPYFVL